jgi:hypothetical protein
MVPTSSNSSACGVLGREGATDSAARLTIVGEGVKGGGKERAEFSVRQAQGKIRRPGMELHIPKSQTLSTLSTGSTGRQ